MENEHNDILHSGALEGLEDYSVFRRRYPARSSLPVRLITDWYIQEIPTPSRKLSRWICLVGIYKDTLIRTSPITSVIAPRKVCTSNCIYMLTQSSKVLQNPLFGVEEYFVEGFPENWEGIIEQAFSRSSVVEGKESVADRHKVENQHDIETDGRLGKRASSFDGNIQLETPHDSVFVGPVVEQQALGSNVHADFPSECPSVDEPVGSKAYAEGYSSMHDESDTRCVFFDEKVGLYVPEEVLGRDELLKRKPGSVTFLPESANVEEIAMPANKHNTSAFPENVSLKAMDNTNISESCTKSSRSSFGEESVGGHAKLGQALNIDLSTFGASEPAAELGSLKESNAQLNDEAIRDINNALNSAINKTSMPDEFNSHDEILAEGSRRHSRQRENSEKSSGYSTVEEFVQKSSPFKLPNAKPSSNSSFEMTNPSNVLQKPSQESYSTTSHDSSFEQSIRSYLKELPANQNAVNAAADASSVQVVGNLSTPDIKSAEPSFHGPGRNATDSTEHNDGQFSNVNSISTATRMDQALFNPSENTKSNFVSMNADACLYYDVQADISEMPKENDESSSSSDVCSLSASSKKRSAGNLSIDGRSDEQLYDEYSRRAVSELAESPQIATDTHDVATAHQPQIVEIVVDDRPEKLDSSITQLRDDDKIEMPFKGGRDSIRKTRLKSFSATPKRLSVATSTEHLESSQADATCLNALAVDSSDSSGDPEAIYRKKGAAEKYESSKRPSIRIPSKSPRTKPFSELESANSKDEAIENSKHSSFLDAFGSVNNDADVDLEAAGMADEASNTIKIRSSLDNELNDNAMDDTRVSDRSILINEGRASVSVGEKMEKLPVKVVSSMESEAPQPQAESPANRSFSKSRKKKSVLVMPKKLKNLPKKPSKK